MLSILVVAACGVVAGGASMALFGLVSPRRRIDGIKEELREIRRKLREYQGDFSGAWPLLRRNLTLSLEQVGLALGPTLAASIPVILAMFWLDQTYSWRLPEEGATVEVRVTPGDADVHWTGSESVEPSGTGVWEVAWPQKKSSARLVDREGREVLELPQEDARRHLARTSDWYARLMGAGGVLPAEGLVDYVEVGVPAQRLFAVGPEWACGWEALFFTLLVVTAVGVKWYWGL